ncbi:MULTISPECIES: phenylalanine--tRNA ligase subunit alpha [unclassified Breznakia]|uniref:phenylalanine--tRNA ligase subunit alpha n=1 Tax=unclassified Breznakia TaxID=2623764 RepID=UPI002474C9A7|nr:MULTISPECIES: phenylalanine--tRNA ligase subunit alpha [unclassified Breznakia]MDH6367472.1 phenylalanyl-tRNA synthetase alpha chain [Breznakia sp. PH1-1]MDH6404555.1 phenylalanyl-tRNA synthetase alpha chain [Breznakia sp. PF1-11]MDH6412264.1 phenylalanyl-tRNA synthetase alpha chain [Breznakia sp. PFB1-11]MDH6414639.1 phenylalanyl-tRNA synthetase alpha chain [Breznakia sp. PFB1-14]MDH6417010.1 phenylalanyl-tRNA synthetase alpha chain [Breznakia sp. PFB1-4]
MEKLETLRQEGIAKIEACTSTKELQDVRVLYLGKKGPIQEVMKMMKDLSPEEKPKFGQQVNEIKQLLASKIEEKKVILEEKEVNEKLINEKIDITLSGLKPNLGNLHPLIMVQQELEDLFIGLGYEIAEGPEVELDLYNFERANIPKGHPARDMQDTFYIDADRLLRTHTTAVQMRVLEEKAPSLPIKVVCPGKVYRRDDDDATHSHQFTQLEGLVVGEKIRLSDLKGTLELVAKKMFGDDKKIRFRPSYFQFTEPSVEVDVSCHICGGKGCPTCKGTGWIEILGAGMVHPNVLSMAGYDPKTASGFAFGIGMERVALLKYGIDDIRHLYTNDVRFLKTFSRFE